MGETVWVVFDPLYERVVAVHRTDEGVDRKLKKLNDDRIEKEGGNNYLSLYEADEFIVED